MPVIPDDICEHLVDWKVCEEMVFEQGIAADTTLMLLIHRNGQPFNQAAMHRLFTDPEVAEQLNRNFVCVYVDADEQPQIAAYCQRVIGPRDSNRAYPHIVFVNPQSRVAFLASQLPQSASAAACREFIQFVTDTVSRLKDDSSIKRQKLSVVSYDDSGEKIVHEAGTADSDHQPRLSAEDVLWLVRKHLVELRSPSELVRRDDSVGSAASAMLLRWSSRFRLGDKDGELIEQAMKLLTLLARSEKFDHVGGGFHDHRVEGRWRDNPQFTKSSGINGHMLSVFSEAALIGRDTLFLETVEKIANWLVEEMQMDNGAFAESVFSVDGEDLREAYSWHRSVLKRLLTEDEYLILETLHGLDKRPNFGSKWLLSRQDAWSAVARRLSMSTEDADELRSSATQKLNEYRKERHPLQKHERVVVASNGLAIGGLVKAGKALGNRAYIEAAQRGIDFLREHCYEDGIVGTSWFRNECLGAGTLRGDSSALMALLEMLSAEWRSADAEMAVDLGRSLIRRYIDEQSGRTYGFPANELCLERMGDDDGHLSPSTFEIASSALLGLGALCGDSTFVQPVSRMLRYVLSPDVAQTRLLTPLVFAANGVESPPLVICIRGPDDECRQWHEFVIRRSAARCIPYIVPFDDPGMYPTFVPRFITLETRDKVTAYAKAPNSEVVVLESREELEDFVNP